MLKRFTLALFLSALAIAVSSQELAKKAQPAKATVSKPVKSDTIIVGKYMVSIYGGYGLSTLKFNPTFGQNSSGTDFTFGADYYYFFNKNWGISAGLNFTSYNSQFTANTNTKWDATDSENEVFGLMAAWNGWREQHKMTTFGIPLMARYRYPINPKWSFMAGIGIKTAFITSSSCTPTAGEVTLSGNYPRLGVIFKNIPLQGFESHQYRDKSELKASINFSAIADIGASYKINPAWSIFAAIYLDYGFSNLAQASNDPLIGYKSANNTPYYNSLPHSNTIANEKSLAIGGKIGAKYDFGGAKLIRKNKADEDARLAAIEALRLAREKAIADSLANALRVRQQQIQDSLNNAARLAALLRQQQMQDSLELARLKHMQDSISALSSKGEGKMVVEVKTDKLAPWEREVLMLPVEFNLGSANITNETKDNATKIGEMLARHPELKIGITGHTCDLGPEEANYKLGLRRANALVVAFEKAGKERDKMTPSSRGELQPAVPNTSNENRKKNRRVVVVIEDII